MDPSLADGNVDFFMCSVHEIRRGLVLEVHKIKTFRKSLATFSYTKSIYSLSETINLVRKRAGRLLPAII